MTAFMYLRASSESSPKAMMWKSWYHSFGLSSILPT